MKTLLKLIVVTTLISGCVLWPETEYATNEKNQYLKSKNGPDLVIPQPLTTSNISDFYHLTDQTKPSKINIVPPAA